MERLRNFPNYDRALEPDTFEHGTLTREVFQREYVEKNRPVVIRGAARHWKMLECESVAQFIERYYEESDEFKCVLEPFGEYLGRWAGEARPDITEGQITFRRAEFMKALEQRPFVTAYAHPFTDQLYQDAESLGFFDPPSNASQTAYSSRCFIYRNGYTDWHFHGQDETVTTQLLGSKELLLVSSESRAFRKFWRVVRRMPVWTLRPHDEDFRDIVPYRVVLRPGDSVLIPVFWWHAAEGAAGTSGVTAAMVFPSPDHVQYNLRYAAARNYLWHALRNHPVARGYRDKVLQNAQAAVRSTLFRSLS